MRMKLLATLAMLVWMGNSYADKIDDIVQREMQRRQIPGLSLAVVDGGKIVKVAAYGTIELGSGLPVTPTTLFQAGSISKSVSALAALHLVEQGKLALDDDVNLKLQSWKVPDNAFTATKKVTLRGILSHTAGLSVHGFPGYAVDEPKPTLIQVLNGEKPANTDPIRVQAEPGSKWDYSGGGYTIMQQLMIDVTGQPYPAIMQSLVLGPLGMKESTYAQPIPNALAPLTASGHRGFDTKVQGQWHIYPEMAAAGLWTTPSDLARFMIGLQQSLAGTSNPVISQNMTAQMMTVQMNRDGLGVFLPEPDREQLFSHGGRDEGFDSMMIGTMRSGQGVIIMINANDNSQMMRRIKDTVAAVYHWPGTDNSASKFSTKKLDAKTLNQLAGHYDFNGQIFSFLALDGHLVNISDGMPDGEFAALDSTHFVSSDGQQKLTFERDNQDRPISLQIVDGDHIMKMQRFSGPIHLLAAQHEPAHLSDKLHTLIQVGTGGGKTEADAAPAVTAGFTKMLISGTDPVLGKLGALKFIATQPVQGDGFARFDSKIASLAYYRISNDKLPKYLIVYLSADGLIGDYDLVPD